MARTLEAPAVPGLRGRRRSRLRLRAFYPVLFLLPTFAFLIVFSYVPFVRVRTYAKVILTVGDLSC